MFTLEVRDHVMIAHSFRGEIFGPAQGLHGATYVIDAAFITAELDDNGLVVDIGRAHDVLKSVLATLNYKNLDELPQFKGINTTTEFLCHHVHTHVAKAVAPKFHGTLRVVLRESPLAEAAYEAPVATK